MSLVFFVCSKAYERKELKAKNDKIMIIDIAGVNGGDPTSTIEDDMLNDQVSIDSSDSDDDERVDGQTTTKAELKKNNETTSQNEFKRVSKHWAKYKKEHVTDADWRRLYPGRRKDGGKAAYY